MSEVIHTHTHTHWKIPLLGVELEVMFTFGCGLAVVRIKLIGGEQKVGGHWRLLSASYLFSSCTPLSNGSGSWQGYIIP